MLLCACCADAGKDNHQVLFSDPRFPYDGGTAGKVIQVTLKYQKGKLGVDLDVIDVTRGLVVKAILPDGKLAEWNRENADVAIRPLDKIIAVNGKVGTVQELESAIVSSGPDLQLQIQRPQRFEVKLQRPGSLGVRLHYKKSSMGILISEVLDEGLATVWNANNPSRVIVAGDRILEVNGESMSPEDMVKKLSDEDEMSLLILHYGKDSSTNPV
eukprot:symbB.v1.2.029651.t1/scaffold3275.1/size59885/3